MNDREFFTYNVEDFDISSGIVHFNLTIILIFLGSSQNNTKWSLSYGV